MINNELNNYKEIFEKGDTMANFKEFLIKKENDGGIIVKEHPHKLVFCISIFDWVYNFYVKKGITKKIQIIVAVYVILTSVKIAIQKVII